MSSMTVAPPATRSATVQRAASNRNTSAGRAARHSPPLLGWRPGTHRLSWAGGPALTASPGLAAAGGRWAPHPAHLAALSATSLSH